MAIFNSYVNVYQRVYGFLLMWPKWFEHVFYIKVFNLISGESFEIQFLAIFY